MINREHQQSLSQALLQRYSIDKDTLKALFAITEPVTLDRNNALLPFEKVCSHLYFVNSGFLRIYYLKNGREVTEWFADEGGFCFSIESYFTQTPSVLCIEALEPSTVLRISKEGLDRLKKENLAVANLLITMYSGSLVLSQQRMNSIQFESAKERYLHLEKHHPNIILKAPLQYIASYLGITSETLSRIRASRN